MRVGQNPERSNTIPGLPHRYAAVITHLPDQESYHSRRMEVIKACLLSMREGAQGVSLVVWDNGSIPELTAWIKDVYQPFYFIQSPNIGKSNARRALFNMVEPGSIMSLCDDDMLFYPGWWEASEQLLVEFPNVGKVSCYPVRTQGRWGCDFTKQWAQSHAELKIGKLLPKEYDYDFCTSIGRDYDNHLQMSKDDQDYQVTYNGLSAYCYAHHCQFMGYVDRLAPLLEGSNYLMADEKPFDIAVDKAGYLQLTTITRYARHIGNVIDKKIQSEIEKMGIGGING